MNNLPEPLRWLQPALWSAADLHEAIGLLAARHGGHASTASHRVEPPVEAGRLADWIEDTATGFGVQAEQTFAGLDEIEELLRHGAPMLLRLAAVEGAPFVALAEATRRSVVGIGRNQRRCVLPLAALAALVREPFEAPVRAQVDATINGLDLPDGARARARSALTRDRLANTRFRGCWLLRLPPGSALHRQAAESRLWLRAAILAGVYAAQYICFIGSWWLLGQAVLYGTVNRGWLLGWALLLASLIPLRLLVTWEQGLLTVTVGAWLRRRLLRGAFQVDRQLVRHKGVGALFTFVMEAAALDAMALSGAVAAAFAGLELAGAAVVLWWGATRWLLLVLALWVAATAALAYRYYAHRRAWTAQRVAMSHDLLETMLGHRTRIIQEAANERHAREDEALEQAMALGDAMDRPSLWLTAVVPRGWLVAALATLVPALAANAAPVPLAITLGGMLLASRALARLAAGLTNLTGAIIAARSVQPLTAAARPLDPPLLAGARHAGVSNAVPGRTAVLQARDLVFRYRASTAPIVNGASLEIERDSRFLLEGASGSGKTTFGALLAGLERPEAGLLLAGGLDRAALGSAAWRSRVVMAPQAHDNYLVGASLAFNLLMGRRWPADAADLKEAEALCRELGLGDLLDRMPGGLDQVVGETGWQLSQGERVRVFLARALLQRPDVLILDESFSALDPENLDRAAKAVTGANAGVLAIAHM